MQLEWFSEYFWFFYTSSNRNILGPLEKATEMIVLTTESLITIYVKLSTLRLENSETEVLNF